MTIEYGRLRAILLEYLAAHPNGQVNVLDEFIYKFIQAKGLPVTHLNSRLICQIFHDFYLERIIAPGQKNPTSAPMDWPWYCVTEYGEKVLKSSEYQPYDPEGYLARIKREIPTIDNVVIRYLDEAMGCLRANFLMSAAVMTGCAAEKAILLLIEQYGVWISDPKKKRKYAEETAAKFGIKRKYDALWDRIAPTASQLPPDLGDDLHTILDRVFDLIRTTRNDAGHPSGKVIERETVNANLILFPGYCRRIYKLLEYYR